MKDPRAKDIKTTDTYVMKDVLKARREKAQRMRIPKEYAELRELYLSFYTRDDGFWIIEWPFAVMLYDFVKEAKPADILDLGTGIGCSSAVMALASPESKIDTMEQFEEVHKIAKEVVPEKLQKNITFYRKDPVIWTSGYMIHRSFSTYESLPDKEYDFILNDGPGPWRDKYEDVDLSIDFPNGTIHKLLLEDKLKPGALITFDKRVESLKFLERYFGNNFFIVENYPQEGWFMLEKKSPKDIKAEHGVELHIEDTRFEPMATQKYWDKT